MKTAIILGVVALMFMMAGTSSAHFKCFGCMNNGYAYGDNYLMQQDMKNVRFISLEMNQGAWAEPFMSSKHFGEPFVGAKANQYEIRRQTYQMSYGYFDNPQLQMNY